MEQTFLKAQVRQHTGSKDAAKLRSSGRIPAVVYGHKQKALAVSLDANDFTVRLLHGHRLLDVELDGSNEKLLVKDIQYDHFGKEVIHADLMRVDLTETVTVTVPIELKGVAKGTHEGGIVEISSDFALSRCGRST